MTFSLSLHKPRLIAFRFPIYLRPRTRANYLPKCSRKVTEKFTDLSVSRLAIKTFLAPERYPKWIAPLRGGRQLLCKFFDCYSPRWGDLLIKRKERDERFEAPWNDSSWWLKLHSADGVFTSLAYGIKVRGFLLVCYPTQALISLLFLTRADGWRRLKFQQLQWVSRRRRRRRRRVRSMCHIHTSRFSFAITYDKDKEQLISRKCFLILIAAAEQNKKRFLIARKIRKLLRHGKECFWRAPNDASVLLCSYRQS